MAKILITGGAGFLGSHLCKSLINENHQVIALDNLYTGRLINLQSIVDHPNFKFLQHDVCSPFNFKNDFDEIYNLACPASPIHYQKKPLETMKTSVNGAFHVLEFAQQNNSRVLQASTSEIYGDPKVHPQPESYWGNVNPFGIRSCYDEGKRAAESIFFDVYRKFQLPIKVVRIFNTYGPFMDPADGRVVSNFIIQALQNKDVTIYGDGKQTRSFCFVDDLIRGLISMMHSDQSVLGPINLGTTDEFTILELAEKVIHITQSKSQLIFKPLPGDDPRERRPDLTKAKVSLNWKPEVSFDNGLLKTIDYFRGLVMS
ncbi:SDR family oxidoreductase [Methylophilaceae bacterium]|nr:SDR family oxidoreductase [Methylophilaceae bacterium]